MVSGLLLSPATGIWIHKFGCVSCKEHLLSSCLLVHFCLQNIATGYRRLWVSKGLWPYYFSFNSDYCYEIKLNNGAEYLWHSGILSSPCMRYCLTCFNVLTYSIVSCNQMREDNLYLYWNKETVFWDTVCQCFSFHLNTFIQLNHAFNTVQIKLRKKWQFPNNFMYHQLKSTAWRHPYTTTHTHIKFILQLWAHSFLM
jgi:hypothetical protein